MTLIDIAKRIQADKEEGMSKSSQEIWDEQGIDWKWVTKGDLYRYAKAVREDQRQVCMEAYLASAKGGLDCEVPLCRKMYYNNLPHVFLFL